MTKKPTMWMLVGLPYSGKSTWTEWSMTDTKLPMMVIDTDSILMDLAKSQGRTYEDAFKDNYKKAEQMMYQRLNIAIASDLNIIWDQTNLTPKARFKKLSMIPHTYEKIAVVFPQLSDEEYAKRVASRPGKVITSAIIDSMKKTYVEPDIKEGFDHILKWSDDLYYV